MSIANFDIVEFGFCNSIIEDYVQANENLKPFYQYNANLEGILQAAKAKAYSLEERTLLITILKEQISKIELSSLDLQLSKENIEKLNTENTFTVTTGQQIHLFLGPGYFGNKIFECIRLSQYINANQHEIETIPVFWMATEDHDTEEIANVELFGTQYKANLKPNIASGQIQTNQIESLTNQLAERLGMDAKDHHFFQICKNAYLQYDNLADATAAIIYSLFGKYGIIVIDANHPKLKAKLTPIVKNELANETSTKLQLAVKEQFKVNQWHYQTMPRTNNFFTISTNGERLPSTSNYIETNNYSPNAILRPIYQELILPNIAYIGGKAEVNYWLQLKPIFDFYKINMPVVWLRPSITITSKKNWKKFENLEISAINLAKFDQVQFENDYLSKHIDVSLLETINQLANQLLYNFKITQNQDWKKLSETQNQQNDLIKKEFRNLKSTLINSNAFKEQKEQIDKIIDLLFNNDKFQERVISIMTLSTNYNYFKEMDNFLHRNTDIAAKITYLVQE